MLAFPAPHTLAAAFLGAACIAPTLAHAQIRATARDTAQLAELTVTSTRLPTRPGAVTVAQTVITGEELRARGIRYVLDALRETPGTQVVQTGGLGGVTSLFVRGGNSNYTKVLVDGAPLNQPGGAIDLSTLTTDNVERIEIVRGPASVLYGADAVTGVVQVFTRRGTGRPVIEGSVVGGTFGTALWDVGARGGSEQLAYSVQFGRTSTSGIYAFNNAFRNNVLSGQVRGHPDDQTDATLAIRYVDGRYNFPTNSNGVAKDSNQYNFQQQLTLSVEGGRRVHERVELRALLTGNFNDTGFQNDPDFPADTTGFGFAARNLGTLQRRGADLRANIAAAPGVTITIGGAAEFESIRQNNQTTSLSGGKQAVSATAFDADRNSVGGYAQAVADLASGLVLNGGVRVDQNSVFGTFFTFRGGAAYQVPGGPRLRASGGRAVRAPAFNELLAKSAFEIGNTALVPERNLSWEVGAEQALLDGRVLVGATWFSQQFDNLIQYKFVSATVPTYYNLAGASARGLETTLAVKLDMGLRLTGQYTYLETEVTDAGAGTAPTFPLGATLLRRPAHTARLGATYRLAQGTTLGANVAYVGARDDVNFSVFPSVRVSLPSFALVDASLDAPLVQAAPGRPGLAALVRAENLFDAQYQNVFGFAGRGRTILAGGRLQY